jgi:DNA-binding XRE family transcriptional regulator
MKQKTLREAREASGLTADQVAEKAGVHRTTLYRVESGDQLPSREVARALYDLYRGTVPWVAIYDPEMAATVRSFA